MYIIYAVDRNIYVTFNFLIFKDFTGPADKIPPRFFKAILRNLRKLLHHGFVIVKPIKVIHILMIDFLIMP